MSINIENVKTTNVDKNIKPGKEKYMVMDREATKADVKASKTDAGGNFYIYNLYDSTGVLLALNRYVYKDSDEQPFEELTEEDELILNPVVEEPEEVI